MYTFDAFEGCRHRELTGGDSPRIAGTYPGGDEY